MAKPPKLKVKAAEPVKKSSELWSLIDAKKDGRLLSEVRRFVELDQGVDEERRIDVMHPSAMSKPDWCPRHDFYAIKVGVGVPENNPFFRQNMFDEGHDIHGRWQTRMWDMGVLGGVFECLVCKHAGRRSRFEAVSPKTCALCSAPRMFLVYREVPLEDDELPIAGHADGDLVDGKEPALVEFKSIGQGTVRIDAPEVVAAHTQRMYTADGKEKSVTDWDALWRNIKRPFLSHLIQANLYMRMKGYRLMIFVYECKWNQQTKEFLVRYSERMIADIIDDARDVEYGLRTGRTPPRPRWADPEEKACKSCPFLGPCWGATNEQTSNVEDEPQARASEAGSTRRRRLVRGEAASAITAARRSPEAGVRPGPASRVGPDEPDGRAHQVGGLLGRPTRTR